MPKNVKINDPLTKALNTYRGEFSQEVEDLIEELYKERINLAQVLESRMGMSVLFEAVNADININPEYPTVYFRVKSRSGKEMEGSALIILGDGDIHTSISAPSDRRDVVQAYIRDLFASPMIKQHTQQINKLAKAILRSLKE